MKINCLLGSTFRTSLMSTFPDLDDYEVEQSSMSDHGKTRDRPRRLIDYDHVPRSFEALQ